MEKKNIIRFLAALFAVLLLTPAASASSVGERLAVERQVYTYLTEELMLSNAAACGVLANIEHESGFRPNALGDQGTSYGLCQWHNERFSALRGYCAAMGLDYRTVEGQLAYLKYELGSNYTSMLLTLQSIDDTPNGAYRAGHIWCIQFERPSNAQVKAAARGELAQGKYWNRYADYEPITIILPQPEETLPSPEVVIEQLRQNPVTIPLPPEQEEIEEGSVRYYKFQKPDFLYYIPHHLPVTDAPEARDLGWAKPTLAAIFAAMVVVVLFPTKKSRKKVYSGDTDVV